MIRFFNENTKINLPHKQEVKKWLTNVAVAEGKKTGDLSVIFCSDEYLLQMNRRFLQHDYYTDIITFDYTEANVISGDLFISIDRVKANAETYKQPFNKELHRVMLHGLLHLCGYNDATEKQRKFMRTVEDKYLVMIPLSIDSKD
ncbi:MAG: rRNA maturation RNase YbeY [Bacteroidales bacterium]|nr:rRNA maturation RNase YbeY [Bacteroidales bacterium]